MIFKNKFILVCILIIGCGYMFSQMIYPTLYIRYKLTVNIADRGVIRTGSGVVEIQYKIGTDVFDSLGGRVSGKMRGNAITVNLGPDGLIFIVNRSSSSSVLAKNSRPADLSTLPFYMYQPKVDSCTGAYSCLEQQVLRIQQDSPPPIAVPPEALPAMIRFSNIQDPHSIEELDPEALEKTFGGEVHFDSAVMELTDEPLTLPPSTWPEWLKIGNPGKEIVSSEVHYPAPKWREDLLGLRINDFRGL